MGLGFWTWLGFGARGLIWVWRFNYPIKLCDSTKNECLKTFKGKNITKSYYIEEFKDMSALIADFSLTAYPTPALASWDSMQQN